MSEIKSTFKEIYNTLKSVDLKGKTKQKQNLTYLPWANAYNIVSSIYTDFETEIVIYPWEGYDNPFYLDRNLGYMVHTKVTINGITREERLPVLDGSNKSLKDKPYTYKVKEYKDRKWTGKYVDKTVEQCSMMDINTAHKRCLVKNLALFGLGIELYIGEDVETFVFDSELAIEVMKAFETEKELNEYYISNKKEFSKNAQVIACFAKRKKELKDVK